jgi:hypothetical protein
MIVDIIFTLHSFIAYAAILLVSAFAIGFAIGYMSGVKDAERKFCDKFLEDD